jgi:hypothetical protein
MPVFPQLATGASVLYPVTKKHVTRTLVNALADGSAVVFGDSDAGWREWELRASGLTLNESTAIDTLFQAVSGRWATFTFLDPFGNLLLRSEEFGDAVWDKDPLIQLTSSTNDPLGTARATHVVNAGSSPGGITQTLAVPGNFRYTLSVWAKTTASSDVTLSTMTTGGSATRNIALTSQWQRLSIEVALGVNTDSVQFGVVLEPGAILDLFGMQLEAQPGMSDYKQTRGSGGVYSQVRFAEDELTVTAKGTDMFDVVLRIVANGN